MIYQKSTQVPVELNHSAKVTRDIDRAGHGRFLDCRLVIAVDLDGGSASGTVITEPASPFGAPASVTLERVPGGYQGQQQQIPLDMLHFASYRWLRGIPEVVALDDGADEAHTAYGQFLIPFTMLPGPFQDYALENLIDRKELRLIVDWGSATAMRDRLLTGCDRTPVFTGTELRATLFYDERRPANKRQVRYEYVREVLTGSGTKKFEPSLNAGERLRCTLVKAVLAGVRSNSLVGGSARQLQLHNGRRTVEKWDAEDLQRFNAATYRVAPTSWPTGIYFLDRDAHLKGDANAQKGRPGDLVQLEVNHAAVSGTTYLDLLYEIETNA